MIEFLEFEVYFCIFKVNDTLLVLIQFISKVVNHQVRRFLDMCLQGIAW